MKKLDLKKTLKPYFQPRANRVELVDVPEFSYLMLDGRVEPGVSVGKSPAFQEAFQAIYGVAFTLKFMSKLRARNPIDYPVMAPEGLWWTKDGGFSLSNPWAWTLMMTVPDHITATMFRDAVERVGEKRPNPSLGYRFRGKHHEIYLGDPRRAKPEKLRTVLRHGVERIPAP